MGDRAQVAIKQDEGLVYLYTHNQGSELQATVRRALAKRLRWNDQEYLARIIFCEMVKEHLLDELGFGIGLGEHGDSQHPLIIVDPVEQTVTIGTKVFKFERYIAIRARVEG